jgi:hypothetical protein
MTAARLRNRERCAGPMWHPSERWRSGWDGEFESPLLLRGVTCEPDCPENWPSASPLRKSVADGGYRWWIGIWTLLRARTWPTGGIVAQLSIWLNPVYPETRGDPNTNGTGRPWLCKPNGPTGFSMGVSAKVAALHTVERDPIARDSRSHAALPSKRCAARQCVRLRLTASSGALSPELQSLIPAGNMVAVIASRWSALKLRRSLSNGRVGRLETLRTSQQILMSLTLLTIFSGESLAHRLAVGERSPRS